jgi:hypothetical protein
MKARVAIAALVGGLIVVVHAGDTDGGCDLKNVIEAHYCEACDAVLEKKDLVSAKTYYVCEDCEESYDEAGACPYCEQPLKKKTSGKDVCPECYAKPEKVEACRKVYYTCKDCDTESLKPGKCPDCEASLAERVSVALVEYICPECGDARYKAGKCSDKECPHFDKPLTRRCTESGNFPHTSKAPD